MARAIMFRRFAGHPRAPRDGVGLPTAGDPGFPPQPFGVMLDPMSGGLEQGPGPGALPDPDRVVIPDDPAALDADLWAWRAEQRRRERAARWAHTHVPDAPTERSTRARFAWRMGPMILGALLLMGFLASLATTVRPATLDAVEPAPTASTSVPDGQVGGLLPPGIVEVNGATASTQEIRPATLVLLPADGASQQLLDSVYLQAQAYGVPMALVGPPERLPLLTSTADEVRAAAVPVIVDRASVIAESLGLPPGADPTIVVVATDGRIHTIAENPPDGIQLQTVLSRAASGDDPVDS